MGVVRGVARPLILTGANAGNPCHKLLRLNFSEFDGIEWFLGQEILDDCRGRASLLAAAKGSVSNSRLLAKSDLRKATLEFV